MNGGSSYEVYRQCRSGLEVRELRHFQLPQQFGVRITYIVGIATR